VTDITSVRRSLGQVGVAFVHQEKNFMIKHSPVTSLKSGRLASAATASLSVARELDRAQNKRRKDRPRDKQHAPMPALT
jgi:hypothetical protein